MRWEEGAWWCGFGVTMLAAMTSSASTSAVVDGVPRCAGHHPQNTLDLDQVMGMWYAVEVVHHWEGPKGGEVGRRVVNTCPVLHLSRPEEPNRLRLLWTENAGVVEYSFNVHDLKRPGFWITLGAQNGTLLTRKPYRHFAGTVEVTKAVGTHMVLTFCTPGQELYSVIMSREMWLPEEELRGVNRMLEHRGLPKISVKVACRNSALLSRPALLVLAAALLFTYISQSFTIF